MHIIESIIRYEFIHMQNKPKHFYARSTLGICPYSMISTGIIIHSASRNYLQPNEEPHSDSFITDYLLEKCSFLLNMHVHTVTVYSLLLPNTIISFSAKHHKTYR